MIQGSGVRGQGSGAGEKESEEKSVFVRVRPWLPFFSRVFADVCFLAHEFPRINANLPAIAFPGKEVFLKTQE
jgi:hypothetical protein